MKKIHTFFFSLLGLILFQSPLLAEEMKVGFSHLSGLIEINEDYGKPTGALVEYWQKIAKQMGVSIKWIGPIPPARLIMYIKNHKIDAISVASKNTEREMIGIFSAKPIFLKKPVVCLRKDINIQKIETWADLEPLAKIGVIHGHRLAHNIAKEFPQLRLAMIKDRDLVNFSLSKLADGELDAFIYPGRTGIMESIKKLGLGDSIDVLDAPVPAIPYYTFFSRQRMDLAEKYNKHHDDVKF